MLPCLLAEEEIQRPAGGDVPRLGQRLEPECRFRRSPGLPCVEVDSERLFRQIQRRQRKIASWISVETTMRPVETPIDQYASSNADSKFCP